MIKSHTLRSQIVPLSLGILAVILLALGFGFISAGAQATDIPEGVQVFHVDGRTFVRDTELGVLIHWCTDECQKPVCPIPTPHPTPTRPGPDPTETPTKKPDPSKTPTPQPRTYCHCEQGEGEGALDRKNCHVAKYNNGHANHEWDYWSDDGTCDGWHH